MPRMSRRDLLLRPLRPRLLPLLSLSLKFLGAGLIALLGRSRLLVYVMVVAPGVRGHYGACEKGHQEKADGEFSHSSA